jgi:hypothetical protein
MILGVRLHSGELRSHPGRLGFAMLGHRQGVNHASPFDVLAGVWHPFGQAAGMAPLPTPMPAALLVPVIPGACPSGEDV